MDLGFVFTNFNNSRYTEQAIASLKSNSEFNEAHIIVVDNASNAEEVEILNKIKLKFPNLHILLNSENIGYFRGLNLGIKLLRNTFPTLEHIVIGNNDLVFPDNFYKTVNEVGHNFSDYPVISPNIITLDGVHQNPHVISSISPFREFIYDVYYSNYYVSLFIAYLAKITKRFTDRNDEEYYDIAQTIYQGYGACYILGPQFFSNFDQLWSPTFLMGEEAFLSLQLKERNMKIYYEPRIIVNHHDHATVSKVPSKRMWKISKKSHSVYREHIKIFNSHT